MCSVTKCKQSYLIRVFHDTRFLSDYLTDLYTGKSKINFVKNRPQWGLNPQPLDHDSNAPPTELSHHFVVCVNHKGLYKVMLY